MLMMIKSDVLCAFSDGGQVREFLTYVSSDSDEDEEDYDDDDYDTNNGGGGGRAAAAAHVQKRGGLCRVVNPPPDGYDDSYECDGGDEDAFVIFPGPDHEHYSHAHLRDLSRTAIKQYNHNTGNIRFEFVELVEASVLTIVEAAFILVIFKACQSGDPMVTTSFRAKARSASKSLIDSSYDIEMVAPLDSQP